MKVLFVLTKNKHMRTGSFYFFLLTLAACGTPRDAPATATEPTEAERRRANGEQVIEVDGAMSLADYLRRVPGLVISGNSVSIRGMGAPLYIIDGVQIGRSYRQANTSVSVFDIDRVEVLKNAADLAIYGRQGQNGVIKIFTRRE